MTMRHQSFETMKQGVHRQATSNGLSFGPLATAITVALVAVMLGMTFVGDWLRAPAINSLEASPSIISPNGDGVQDLTNFSYTLNEDAEVTVQVFDGNGNWVQTLTSEEFQTQGQHVAQWNGQDSLSQLTNDGQYRIEVTAQGTVRSSTESAVVTLDTVPPTLRVANLEEANRVREANFSITGITDPDAVVQLGDSRQIIPVDEEGQFTIKQQLVEGSNPLALIATDQAGNVSQVARDVLLVTKPPEIAVTGPTNDFWTNESLINVTGTAPADTLLKVNGQEAAVTQDGAFSHELILQEGDNAVVVEATDDVGNTTAQELIVHRKTTAPVLELNIADQATFQQADIQVIGKTEPGAIVTIGGQTINVSPLGEFQTSVQLLQGNNLLDVAVQDQAGNVTTRQRRINYEVGTPQSEWTRVMNNLPSLSNYLVPAAVSLPVMLMLAYFFTRPVSLVLSAERSNFRPGLPDEGRYLRLAVDLSKSARTTVEIRNKFGQTVSTLQHRRYRTSGQQTLFWNGYDDFGRVVPPGEYSIHAVASTPNGTVNSRVNIAVSENSTVHRQYLRTAPQSGTVPSQQRQRDYVDNTVRQRQSVGRTS